jgi:hypothetical protein
LNSVAPGRCLLPAFPLRSSLAVTNDHETPFAHHDS